MGTKEQLMEQAVEWLKEMDENSLRIVLVFLGQLRGDQPR